MEPSQTIVKISVLLFPMIDGICTTDSNKLVGTFNELVFKLNEITNTLELKLPSSLIAVRIEDQQTDAVIFYTGKRFYDHEKREIRIFLPTNIYDTSPN